MVPRTRLSVKTIQIPVFHSRPTVTLASQRQRLGGSHAKFRSWNKNNPEKKNANLSHVVFPTRYNHKTNFFFVVCVWVQLAALSIFFSQWKMFSWKFPFRTFLRVWLFFRSVSHHLDTNLRAISTQRSCWLFLFFCLNYFLSLSALGSWPTLKWITKPLKRPVKVKKFVSKLAPRLATALNFMDVISTTRICWFPR